MPEGILGIDISNNNPNVPMSIAYMQGVRFCIAKASQGWAGGPGGWLDWTWVDIVTRARVAGIIPGGYHWLLKGNGAAQAQQFVASLKRAGGPQGFLCGVDIEENSWDQSLNADPQTVNDFLTEWDQITGKQPLLLYGASWYHDGYMHAGNAWPTRPLWWAGYTPVGVEVIEAAVGSVTPHYMAPFGGWSSYTIRQFTSNAIVGGVQVDANVTYLTLPQLQALTAPPEDYVVTEAQYQQLLQTLQQLVTVIQGPAKPGSPNPFGLVGTRDLNRRLEAIEQKLGIPA